jgi:hypothetical protein
MKFIQIILSYIFGTIFIVGGLLNILPHTLIAIAFILCGLIIFPPIRKTLSRIPNSKTIFIIIAVIIGILLWINGYIKNQGVEHLDDSRILYEMDFVIVAARRYCRDYHKCASNLADVKTLPNLFDPTMIKPEYYLYTPTENFSNCEIIPKLSTIPMGLANKQTCKGKGNYD